MTQYNNAPTSAKSSNSLTLNYMVGGGKRLILSTDGARRVSTHSNLRRTGLFPAAVFLFPVLNHDFNKIYKMNKIFPYNFKPNPANLDNLVKIMVQTITPIKKITLKS